LKPIDLIVSYLKFETNSLAEAKRQGIYEYIVTLNTLTNKQLIQINPEYFMIQNLWCIDETRWQQTTPEHFDNLLNQLSQTDVNVFHKKIKTQRQRVLTGIGQPKEVVRLLLGPCPWELENQIRRMVLVENKLTKSQWLITPILATALHGSNMICILHRAIQFNCPPAVFERMIMEGGADLKKCIMRWSTSCVLNLINYIISGNRYALLPLVIALYDNPSFDEKTQSINPKDYPEIYFMLKHAGLTKSEHTSTHIKPIEQYSVVKHCAYQRLRRKWRRFFYKGRAYLYWQEYMRPPKTLSAEDLGGPGYLSIANKQQFFCDKKHSASIKKRSPSIKKSLSL